MMIRYIGAFRGRQYNILDSVRFELQQHGTLVAATKVCSYDNRRISNIGLLMSSKSARRYFPYDCWSEKRPDGTLYPTSSSHYGQHNEIWCIPHYRGIVVRIEAFRKSQRDHLLASGGIQDCIDYCRSIDVPVYILKNLQLQEYRL